MLVHSGPAKVYDSEDEAIAAICGKQIEKGDVVVIRYEGPKGGPGMREMLNPTSVLAGMGLDKDVHSLRMGVFPVRPAGPASVIFPLKHVKAVILHLYKTVISSKSIFPTAHLMLKFLTKNCPDVVEAWICPPPKVTSGYLARYAALVSSAATGAVLKVPDQK